MRAAIDVGSNSVRMLIQPAGPDLRVAPQYFRQVTRLAGGFDPKTGLDPQSMARTLDVLEQFSAVLQQEQILSVKSVGTAVLRQAANSQAFIASVRQRTGLEIEIIDGEVEASLSCRGILSVLRPPPARALLFDLGGGSTEIILFEGSKICLQKSFPLGVVRLFEDCPDPISSLAAIEQILAPLIENPTLQKWQQDQVPVELVGTAGTVTTLAALKLKMVHYDGRLVNNLNLDRTWLTEMNRLLPTLSVEERSALPGMEKGRADVIVPGLQIVCRLLDIVDASSLRVADAGLLEGMLL